ncbi:MAG TPA: hypothetical protein VHZ28_10265 [Terracidiphilus sp.]|jgi:hypothetical protein|nr:hypothetical protein [Terracidiphilus sp.]
MHRRTRRTLLIVAGVVLLLVVAVYLRSKAPPEAARLLPESDGILYINFTPFRAFFHKQLKPPERVPEYQQFVEATGVDWERDLDQAAVALHRMPNPNGPNGPVAYSMVLVGKLTGTRLNTWLDTHATAREIYAGHTVYSIPSDGRTVRLVQIGYDMLAISNFPEPEKIHAIIDRHRTAALPFAGSSLLAHHFHEVPLLSLAWGVGQIGLPFSESGQISILGLSLPLQDGATIVASVTPTLPLAGGLRLRAEEITNNEQDAESQTTSLNLILSMARNVTAPLMASPTNDGLREILKTAQIAQKHDRVVVTATLTPSALKSIAAGAQTEAVDIPAK